MTTPTIEKFGTEAVNVGERWRHVVAQTRADGSVLDVTAEGVVLLQMDSGDRVCVGVGDLLAYWVLCRTGGRVTYAERARRDRVFDTATLTECSACFACWMKRGTRIIPGCVAAAIERGEETGLKIAEFFDRYHDNGHRDQP